eukprot:141156-Amphidinium_carterae.1
MPQSNSTAYMTNSFASVCWKISVRGHLIQTSQRWQSSIDARCPSQVRRTCCHHPGKSSPFVPCKAYETHSERLLRFALMTDKAPKSLIVVYMTDLMELDWLRWTSCSIPLKLRFHDNWGVCDSVSTTSALELHQMLNVGSTTWLMGGSSTAIVRAIYP